MSSLVWIHLGKSNMLLLALKKHISSFTLKIIISSEPDNVEGEKRDTFMIFETTVIQLNSRLEMIEL